jgi:hypothetical protein
MDNKTPGAFKRIDWREIGEVLVGGFTIVAFVFLSVGSLAVIAGYLPDSIAKSIFTTITAIVVLFWTAMGWLFIMMPGKVLRYFKKRGKKDGS